MTKKILLALFSLLFALVAFAACGSGNTNGGAENTTTEAPAEPVEVLAVGDSLTLENWELTVDEVEFRDELRSGLMVFSPDGEDRAFAYVSVTITNRTEERRMMFPSLLQTPRQLVASLRYDDGGRILQVQVRGYGRAALDRAINANATIEAPLIFQVNAAMAESTQPLQLEIRTNAGETVGIFALR